MSSMSASWFCQHSFLSSDSLNEEKKNDNGLCAEDAATPAEDGILSIVQQEDWYKQPLVVLIVGASGDLAKKKTYPALFELWKARLLPADTIICGFARTPHTHQQLRDHIRPYLVDLADDDVDLDCFLGKCFYKNGKSYGDSDVIHDILQTSQKESYLHNLLVYLAIPPHVFGQSTNATKTAMQNLAAPLPGFIRIVLEKPFGRDTDTCQELLDELRVQKWDESELYRIDHYLGKEMVQNILVMRQNNAWLAPLWNKNVVEAVHLVFKEPFGTEGRGGYFDPFGIHRDILQNHLLQVLTLIAMDMPGKLTANYVRDAKVHVLKSMSIIEPSDCLFGQYDGYKDDPTIENHETTTPTYACVRCNVNTDTWSGVPFIMEAGKALDERICEARLVFRDADGIAAKRGSSALVLRLQPVPAIFLTTHVKTPGYSSNPVSTHMGVDYGQCPIPDAYTRLLLDVFRGEQANFVRDDELLEAWKIFTPVLQKTEFLPPRPYVKGSDGPVEREQFLKAAGIHQPCLPTPASL